MAVQTDVDRRHLARAIELAEQGRGRVSPNLELPGTQRFRA